MTELSRLRWACRRGMKELDVVMTRYLENQYEMASTKDQHHFKALLEMPDADLYSLLLGRTKAATEQLEQFAQSIRNMSGKN
jgi:antitoxin CptB